MFLYFFYIFIVCFIFYLFRILTNIQSKKSPEVHTFAQISGEFSHSHSLYLQNLILICRLIFPKVFQKFVFRKRLGIIISLYTITIVFPQEYNLFFRLCSFCHQLHPQLQNTASFSGILENIRSTATVSGICSRNVITLSKYSSFEHTVILPFSYQSHNRVFLAI